MTTPTTTSNPIVDQVAALAAQVAALQSQKVTYVQAPVTAVDTTTSTFTAQMPAQQDGAAVPLAGIASPPQFLPAPGSTATIALSGATPVYQPTQIAPGAITAANLSPNAPAAPTGLTLSSTVATASDGTTHASIVATWTAPTTTVGGAAISGTLAYQVQYKPTTRTGWGNQTAPTTTAVVAATAGMAYNVQVAAVDQLGNVGAYTPSQTITAGSDSTPPSPPSTPIVDNYLGQLKVTWDGKLTGGVAPPPDFAYVEVHVNGVNGFTPSATTLVSQLSAAGLAYADAAYGTTMYAKLIAVDFTGNKSTPSAQASGVTEQVVGADILAGAVAAAQLADLSVSTSKLVDSSVIQAKIGANAVGSLQLADLAVDTAAIGDAAVVTAKIANLAVNTAKIGNLAVGTAQMADLSVATAKINDLAVVNAKLGSLAVNDAKIGGMSVGKLTAGTMTADVAMSGRFTTALTGARVEMNSLGFQKFNPDGSLAVSITGTDTLLHGEFKTATSGRRIEIGASGNVGSVDFYAPDNEHCFIKAWTETFGPQYEAIQMGLDVGGHVLFNRVNVDDIPQIRLDSQQVYFLFPNNGWFKIQQYNTSSDWTVGLRDRMIIDNTGFSYHRPDGLTVFDIMPGNANRTRIMPNGIGTGSIEVGIPVDTGQSPRMYMYAQNGSGILQKAVTGHHEFRDLGDTVCIDTYASAFNVSSDEDGKTNIQDFTVDAATKVKGLRPRTYKRKPGKDKDGNLLPAPPAEVGLVVQEAPAEIIAGTPLADGTQGINLYAYVTLLAAAVQQVIGRIETLEGKNPKGKL